MIQFAYIKFRCLIEDKIATMEELQISIHRFKIISLEDNDDEIQLAHLLKCQTHQSRDCICRRAKEFSLETSKGKTLSISTNTSSRSIGKIEKIRVYIITLTGQRHLCHIAPSDTVLMLKEMCQKLEGTPVKEQRLIFAGKQLEDHRTLADYNIRDECSVHLVLQLRGS